MESLRKTAREDEPRWRMSFSDGRMSRRLRKEDEEEWRTYRMFTETVFKTGKIYHLFIPVERNESELEKLEAVIRAYDQFQLDSATHSRKFTLSKFVMREENIRLSAPDDGSAWKVLIGKLSSVPDLEDARAALSFCGHIYDGGLERFMIDDSLNWLSI